MRSSTSEHSITRADATTPARVCEHYSLVLVFLQLQFAAKSTKGHNNTYMPHAQGIQQTSESSMTHLTWHASKSIRTGDINLPK